MIKALELCGTGSETCTGCPYYGMGGCDRRMCDDALTLLKAKENDNPTYHTAIIYTKRDNLSKWLQSNLRPLPHCTTAEISHVREEYAREREIQLILLVRHEDIRIGGDIKHRCICRIKCPINPLPIKGEFQCVSTSEMTRLLTSMGWTYKEKIHSAMFK